jgi:sugar lactone lactonase YvrE
MRSITRHSANRIAYTIIVILSIQTAIAQSVGIGTTSPNPSARLEVNSTTQGILIPTLTSAQRSAISNPATGLLVFQTDGTPGFYYYTGVCWLNIANGLQPNSAGVSSSYGLTTTLAGSGSADFADGSGTAAKFNGPFGVAVDASGNVYVADISNQRIRKVTAAGVVTTLAGTGNRGHADGTGATATFDFPSGVAVDVSGNIYVADRDNHKIRKITTTGGVTTLAGNGTAGFADGTGTTAYFNSPGSIAMDASGNIYVADRFNNRIRKISSTGEVTTLAGSATSGADDATGAAASFREPYGVAVDASGNIYVADMMNHKIRKIIPLPNGTGVVSTLAGSGLPGFVNATGTAAMFDRPGEVAIDAFGNVYVTELLSHRVRKITAAGVVTTLAGGSRGFADATGTAAMFDHPTGLAVDASGNVYVADRDNNKIRKIIVW